MTLAGLALTGRELELVRLLAEGYTNAEIGARIHVTASTVRDRLQTVALKMDLTNGDNQRTPGVLRARIVQRAYHLGLIA